MKKIKLSEEQLKKNEELQTITEEIVEMKNELQSRIQRLAQRQKNQMETLAFCLQNSGNPQIEEVSNRILSNDYYNYQLNSPISKFKWKWFNKFKEKSFK